MRTLNHRIQNLFYLYYPSDPYLITYNPFGRQETTVFNPVYNVCEPDNIFSLSITTLKSTMLTLAIGDIFIPERVIDLPQKFRKLLAPNPNSLPTNPKIAQVLCLGNITQSGETLKFLYDLSPSFNIVRGEFDDSNILSQQLGLLSGQKSAIKALPFYKVVTADNFRIGFTNGYQIVPRNDPLTLLAFAREINVDILIWGGTHRVEAYTLDGKFFINPGSATGAFNLDWPELNEDEEDDEGSVKSETGNSPKRKTDDIDTEKEEKAPEKEEVSETQEVKQDDVAEDYDVDLASSIPSFCLMDTQGNRCTLYIYTHMDGNVKVDKVMYHKE